MNELSAADDTASPNVPHALATPGSTVPPGPASLQDIGLSDGDGFPDFDVPPMRVVVLLAGTIGDVMPFVQMAKVLHERYGHVTRICSHADLRAPVEQAGLRFYPLGGNAKQMAGWGPSFSLVPMTLLKLALNPDTTKKLIVCRAMISGCLGACTAPDPNDPNAEPFHADVIMANPMCLGHIHCAEALGVPLHLFFPNPWVATKEYPHSFSGWGYPSKPTPNEGIGYEWVKRSAHFLSYRLVDGVLWHTFLPYVNDVRARARLRTLRLGNFFGGTILSEAEVPFSQMWSPSLSARPSDWPKQCDVVGFFFWDQKASEVDESSPELAPLVQWLHSGSKPVYIGFGSMVFNGLKTARMIVEAARQTGVRVLMQTTTSGGNLELSDPGELPPNVFCIGRCPHDWLLPKVAAVIHHGGAGTVGAGLRLGLPTMCCPFFGDQFFYSHAVAATGSGPPPVPFEKLTASNLADRLSAITQPNFAEAAKALAAKINSENGLEEGLAAFNRHLPLDSMVCDVSTLLREPALGRHYYPLLRIKVSDEVHLTLSTSTSIDQRLLASRRPHLTKQWHLGSYVRSLPQGLATGLLAAGWELVDGVISLILLPVQAACWNGFAGLIMGIFAAFLLCVLRMLYAPIILFDRVATGLANSSFWSRLCCGCMQGPPDGISPPVDHVVDPEPALNMLSQLPRGTPVCSKVPWPRMDAGNADGASRLPLSGRGCPLPAASPADGARRIAIEEAFSRVVALRRAFDALDASSNDDLLSMTEVGTLSEAVSLSAAAGGSGSINGNGNGNGHGPRGYPCCASAAGGATMVSSTPPSPSPSEQGQLPFEPDRLPQLAASIAKYLRAKAKTHLAFPEFVLLCREHAL